jgi:hypothetical protein
VFDVTYRDRVRERVLNLGSSDARVVAGAVLGSLAHEQGDRWSDLDLMFAVSDNISVSEVLEDWTATIADEFGAVRLFDLLSGSIVYRVILFPNCLELDLSFTTASSFGAGGPKFRLLFGETVELPEEPDSPADELFGYAAHHVLHARVCIERERWWQAEYWISAARDKALHLACRRRGLDGWYGRDFDRLPSEILRLASAAIGRTLDCAELDRALQGVVSVLLAESVEASELADRVRGQLQELASHND